MLRHQFEQNVSYFNRSAPSLNEDQVKHGQQNSTLQNNAEGTDIPVSLNDQAEDMPHESNMEDVSMVDRHEAEDIQPENKPEDANGGGASIPNGASTLENPPNEETDTRGIETDANEH